MKCSYFHWEKCDFMANWNLFQAWNDIILSVQIIFGFFFLLLTVKFYGGIHAVLIDEKSTTSEMKFLILMDQFWREKKLTVYEKKILLLP